MRILAWPAFDTGELNPYTRILYRHLGPHGVQVEDFRAWRALWSSYDIFHLHWPEYYVANRNPLKAAIGTIGLLFLVFWCRMRGAKVVWTAHNLGSHNRTRPQAEKWFWRAFTTLLDGYICLTEGGRQQARQHFSALNLLPGFVVPHGHYRGEYPNGVNRREAREHLNIGANAQVFMFFGTIARYKNVPELIRAFRQSPGPEKVLLIAGACPSLDDQALLRCIAKADSRIKLHLGFVSRENVQLYFQATDLVVLPFREILNSGSALLALSFNRPILVPSRGAMPELQAQVGPQWIRTYSGELTPSELTRALEWATTEKRLEEAPLDHFDWSRIAKETLKAYRNIAIRNRDPRLDSYTRLPDCQV